MYMCTAAHSLGVCDDCNNSTLTFMFVRGISHVNSIAQFFKAASYTIHGKVL